MDMTAFIGPFPSSHLPPAPACVKDTQGCGKEPGNYYVQVTQRCWKLQRWRPGGCGRVTPLPYESRGSRTGVFFMF